MQMRFLLNLQLSQRCEVNWAVAVQLGTMTGIPKAVARLPHLRSETCDLQTIPQQKLTKTFLKMLVDAM